MSVRLEGVRKSFGETVAVHSLSLEVEAGRFVTFLGPSGCGKTTTLRMIGGFEQADSGEIYVDGKAVTNLPPFRRNVSTVFQDYALFPHMTVLRNVEYGLRFRGVRARERKRFALAMLERVGLAEHAGKHPGQLSGGQKQRVALARALITEPKALLLDEPLSALDARLRQDMQLELKHLQEQTGTTFIYVTHDQEEALVMSDQIAVMNEGRVQQLGSPEEIYQRPSSLFVARFIGRCNFLSASWVSPKGRMIELEGGGRLEISEPTDEETRAARHLQVAVRPEAVELEGLAVDETGGGNRLQVVLREVIFSGSVFKLRCELPDGELLEIEEKQRSISPEIVKARPGERLTVRLPSDALRVFAAAATQTVEIEEPMQKDRRAARA